jgi:protein-disulfide isomerase
VFRRHRCRRAAALVLRIYSIATIHAPATPIWHHKSVIALFQITLQLLTDLLGLTALAFRQRRATAAEILVLRRQLALYQERGIKPRRIIMKRGLLAHWRIAALVLAQALFLALPTVVTAQSPPLIPSQMQKHILAEPGVPTLGAAHADIMVVEYFDYNCPFCKALAPAFHPFVDQDHATAVLYKEWPIFRGVSVYAAQSALAANYQDKYLQAHDALMSAPRLGENQQVDAALRAAGIDMAQLQKDLIAHKAAIDSLLKRNDTEAHGLGLRGTPGILVGRQIVSGISDLSALRSAVAVARRGGTDR